MLLKVLVDNNTYIDQYYLGEPALSYYLEDGDSKILFDTGYSDVFISNALKMGINLDNINTIILSHGHDDHTGGLTYLKDKDLSNIKLIAHPGVFDKRSHNNREIGSPVSLKELKVKEYIDGSKPIKITENLYFLGQINRVTSFENRTIGTLSNGEEDKVLDDSALVYKGKDGLFIITACSHSGICNIIENAKKLLNDNRIIGVIGGFHLLNNDKQLEETVKYFKENNIDELYPCHCVSFFARAKMLEVSNVHEVAVGFELNIH